MSLKRTRPDPDFHMYDLLAWKGGVESGDEDQKSQYHVIYTITWSYTCAKDHDLHPIQKLSGTKNTR